ncbi:MAG: DNA polymerase III subunit alpha [Propionibacteriaceae bacterium]|nr:DNA polymerase III subunit alpha [Propionibacteriaceae bacterium]
MSFVHLHVNSCFSNHYGTAWPEELVAAQSDAAAAALTDRDGVYGAIRHIRACQQHRLAPIVGADLLMADMSSLTVLAHGHDHGYGWASLSRLVSAAHRVAGQTRRRGSNWRLAALSFERVKQLLTGGEAIGVDLLLGPDSDVGRAVLSGDYQGALDRWRDWQRLLPDHVHLEIVNHYARPGLAGSVEHAAGLLALAVDQGASMVLTNAVRYRQPADVVTGDLLDAAGALLPLGDFDAQGNAEAWLKPAGQMRQVAADVVAAASLSPSVVDQLFDQTAALADRCLIDPDGDLGWCQPKVPEMAIIGLSGADPQAVLRQRCWSALPQRMPTPTKTAKAQIISRLDNELSVIEGFGFASYFLVVADIVDTIRQMGIRAQARGSGAGSLVNYLLGVSSVDPLEHDLLFERFLGEQRSTLPDIDVDVESARRHEIYRAITKRYGLNRVTLLSMHNQYRARGAVRDVGLALGLSAEMIDDVAKSLWRLDADQIAEALERRPELRDLAARVRHQPQLRLLLSMSARLDRLPRHLSMHPCGVLLSDQNLLSLTATQPSGLGIPMSQFDKDDIDYLGLLKLDVLGVRMQSAIAFTIDEIERHSGQRVDASQLPDDDPATFAAIASGQTLGMFQIESPGQRELVGKMRPDCMADLVADISLFRPGPMKGNMITPYVEAKLGFSSTAILHPRFRSFLADSHGVVIYHEHVLRILADCMAISLAEADELRRRLGGSTMGEIETDFRRRASQRRDQQGQRLFTDSQIDKIWSVLQEFGSFGFCKAHAAAFAATTYQSAWLKTHHPVEFMAGLLEHDPGMYPKRLLVAEAKRLGIAVWGIDANRSGDHWRVETQGDQRGIRLPFTQLKGIAQAEVQRLIAGQPYESIADLLARARPHRPTMRHLAALGAFDQLAPRANRAGIIAQVRLLTARQQLARQPQQEALLGLDGQTLIEIGAGGGGAVAEVVASAEAPTDVLAAELDLLGIDVSQHVLDPWRERLNEWGVTPADQLLKLRNNSSVLVAGMRVASQTPPTKSGKRVVFLSLDDGSGVVDCAFFDEGQRRIGPELFRAPLLAVHGHTRRTGERGISITADLAWDFTQQSMPTLDD